LALARAKDDELTVAGLGIHAGFKVPGAAGPSVPNAEAPVKKTATNLRVGRLTKPLTPGRNALASPKGTRLMVTRRPVLRRFPGVTDVLPGFSRGLLHITFQFPGRSAGDLAHCLINLAPHLLSNAFDLVLVHDAFLRICDRCRVNQLRHNQYRKSASFVNEATGEIPGFANGKSRGRNVSLPEQVGG
jgi:hypothetical protein